MHAYVLGAEKRCTSGLVRKTPETDLRAQAIELDVSDAKHGSLHARSIAVARNGLSWIKAGHKHGRYTLIHRLYYGAWMARCECGAESVLNPSNPVDRQSNCIKCLARKRILFGRCSNCGTTNQARFNKIKHRCDRCDRRYHRNGKCDKCGNIKSSRCHQTYCKKCDEKPVWLRIASV